MSRAVKQPVGQKRLTNVAVVRLRKGGARFEVACYKNKVLDWRHGAESDLDEVLQTMTVFDNVSKGVVAKDNVLQKVFRTLDQEVICKLILAKGELQVSEGERALQLDSRLRDVATIVVEKCVDSNTGRPFPHALVERALKDPKTRFIPDLRKSAKQQFLEVLPRLKEVISVARARMRIRLTIPGKKREAVAELKRRLKEHSSEMETEQQDDAQYSAIVKLDPGAFRQIDSLVRGKDNPSSPGKANVDSLIGRLEILDLAVHEQKLASETTASRAADDALEETQLILVEPKTDGGATNGPAPALAPAPPQVKKKDVDDRMQKRFKCNSCKVSFDTTKDHREHFKCEWHRVNLKRKSEGLPPLTMEESEAFSLLEADNPKDLIDYC